MTKKKKCKSKSKKALFVGGDRVFTLDVFLLSGPVSEEFAKKNPVISRTIQIRGNQTLEQLHDAIFWAFEREEEHMYEFQVGGKHAMDRKAKTYVLPNALEPTMPWTRKPAGCVTRTSVGSLGLKVNDAFGYWFDFGDDWWHQIDVVAIEEAAPDRKYPVVTKRVGESPPQYMIWEDEEDDDDEVENGDEDGGDGENDAEDDAEGDEK